MKHLSPGTRSLVSAVVAAATIAAMAGVGQVLFFWSNSAITLASFAGLVAAIAVKKRLPAAGAAFVGVLGGAGIASLVAAPGWGPIDQWIAPVGIAALVAAAVGFVAASVDLQRGPLRRIFSAVCVFIVIGAMSGVVLSRAQEPLANGETLLQSLVPSNANARITSDEALFGLSIRGLADGKPYYATMRDLLVRRNHDLPDPVDARAAVSYRLPTLYWFLARAGGSGFAVLMAVLVAGWAAVCSAYLLCRRFVTELFALVGAVCTASFVTGFAGGIHILNAEFWAGMLGLVFLAAFVWGENDDGTTNAWIWVALAAALLAALVRELGIAFLLVGLVASLAAGRAERIRRVLPWVLGVVVFAAAYVAHWRAVAAAVAILPPTPASTYLSWIQSFGIPLASAVWFVGVFLHVSLVVAISLFLLGIVSSLVGPRRLRDRLAAGLVVAGGSALSLFLGTGGSAHVGRLTPPTWSLLFVPSLLACVPLLLSRWRRGDASVPDAPSEPAVEQPL